MAASNTRFTQNSLGQSKTPIDSDHGIYRDAPYGTGASPGDLWTFLSFLGCPRCAFKRSLTRSTK